MDHLTKPLILLEDLPAQAIAASRLPGNPPALAAALAKGPAPEACFRALRAAGERHEAMRFLAAALRRRVQVWFGWVCVREVQRQARAHRAALAAKGEAGVLGMAAMALPAPGAGRPAQLFGVALDPGVSEADFAPRRPPPLEGVDLADQAAWPAPHLDAEQNLHWLPEPLHRLADHPMRARNGAERFFALRKQHLDGLGPEERRAWLEKDARSASVFREIFGMSAAELVDLDRGESLRPADTRSFDDPANPHLRLRRALEGKKDEINGVVQGWMDRVKAALKDLPQAPALDLSGDTPLAGEAMEAARAWILDPSAEKGRAAYAIGGRCQGLEQAAGSLALACHYSGTDIAPAGSPPGMPPIPPPPALAPNLVIAALDLARRIPDTGRSPEDWLGVFLDLGEQVAQGILTWDAALHEGHAARPWAGREGFGRQVAPPPPPA